MTDKYLGRLFADGETVVRQGDEGHCMFVVLSGNLEVLHQQNGKEVPLAVLGTGDIFGEMALFEREARSATVRASGEARVLTLDKRTLLRRVAEDPLIALNLIEILCRRIRALNAGVGASAAGQP